MAMDRTRKTIQEQVGALNNGTDSVEEVVEGDGLTEDQQVFLQSLEHVGERLPSRGRDGCLPAWGGMDFTDMTAEQQAVYLVGSLTKVAAEGAIVLESEGSDYEETVIAYSKLLHELDRAAHAPLDLKDEREQDVMDKIYHLSEEANGTRQEIMTAAENNISALAIELQTSR